MPILGSSDSTASKDLMSKTWTNGDTIIWLSWKHCGKRRNCLLQAISPFPTKFSKNCLLLIHQNEYLWRKGLFPNKPAKQDSLSVCLSIHHCVGLCISTCIQCSCFFVRDIQSSFFQFLFNPPQNKCFRGYTGISLSVCPSMYKILVSVKVLAGVVSHI